MCIMESENNAITFSFFGDKGLCSSPLADYDGQYSPSSVSLFNSYDGAAKQSYSNITRTLFPELPIESFSGKRSQKNRNGITQIISSENFLIPEPPEERFSQFKSPTPTSGSKHDGILFKDYPSNRSTSCKQGHHAGVVFDIKEEVMSPCLSTSRTQEKMPIMPVHHAEASDLVDNLLDWAHRINLASMLEGQCLLMEEGDNILPVYEFMVSVDVQELINYNATIGSIVLKSPLNFSHILKEACYNILKSDGMLKKLYSPYQMIVKPIFTNVPNVKEIVIESTQCLSQLKRNVGKLFKVRGLVIGMSSTVTYTKSATYRCPERHCVWSGENCYLITSAPGSLETDVIRTYLPCGGCGSILIEDISKRTFGNKRYYFVIPKEATKNLRSISKKDNHRSQAMKMLIKDGASDIVHIGGYYWFSCIHRNDVFPASQQVVQTMFEVFTVEQDVPFVNRVKNFQKLFPDPICALYRDRKSSPWSFVSSLAYSFLDVIYPPGMFHLFKTLLLFSLVMEGDTSNLDIDNPDEHGNVNKLHILVQDEEMLAYQRQMLYSTSFSDSTVVHRVPIDLFGSVHDDGTVVYVDGGSLSLASTGICVIPNLLELKKNLMEQLQKALESGTITVNIPRKQHDEVQLTQFFLPLRSSVWCCCEIQRSLSTKDISHKEVSSVPPALSSQFHLVLSNRTNKWNGFDHVLASHILEKALQKESTGGLISHEDMLMAISRVRSHEVMMSLNAYKLIKTFYLASRRVNYSSHVSQISLQALLRLSAAHAKLMLHKKVTINDAVVGIYIFEQLIALRIGESILGVSPVFHFERKNMSRHIGPENDIFMYQLKRHIIQYCSTYYPDISQDLLHCEE